MSVTTVDELLAYFEKWAPGDYVYGPDDGPEKGHFVYVFWQDNTPHGDGAWEVEVRHSPTLVGALEEAALKAEAYL